MSSIIKMKRAHDENISFCDESGAMKMGSVVIREFPSGVGNTVAYRRDLLPRIVFLFKQTH